MGSTSVPIIHPCGCTAYRSGNHRETSRKGKLVTAFFEPWAWPRAMNQRLVPAVARLEGAAVGDAKQDLQKSGLAEEWPWLWNNSKDLLNAKLTHGNLQVIRQLLLDCKPQAWFSEVMVSWTLFLHVLDDQFNAMIVVWHNLPFFPWECRWLEISHEQDIFLKGNNCSSWLIRFHCSGGLRFLGSDVGGGWSSCYAAAGRGGAGTGEVVASKRDSSKEIKWPVV